MAEFIEVMQARKELCKDFVCNSTCPLRSKALELNIGCHGFFRNYPEEAEQVIMDWKGSNDDVTTDCDDCRARIRAEVIDEFVAEVKNYNWIIGTNQNFRIYEWIDKIAEDLKERNNG